MRIGKFALAGLLAAGLAVPALADAISDRQDAMKAVGKNMKVLGDTFKGDMAFEGAAVAEAGNNIAVNLNNARDLFPEDSQEGGDTRAKPEIWSDLDKFLAILDRGEDAAGKVAAAGEANDEGAFKAAFAELGGACKDCHEGFRKPKE